MFFLITGASGVGKSTLRERIAAEFGDSMECTELGMLGLAPRWSLEWRHQAVEQAVLRAIEVQTAGQDFLLCGDPVPPGELFAAPSADKLGGIAVCLLDASAEAQEKRLRQRGDPPELLLQHIAFAEWMRTHVLDHTALPEVVMQGGWETMRWDRWLSQPQGATPWKATIIDTSTLTPDEVANPVISWIRGYLSGNSAPDKI